MMMLLFFFFFFRADQHKTKITNTLQLLLNYGSRFIDKSIWQKCSLFHYLFASNLNFSLTFSKSYGKMKNILKAIVGWFAAWDHNVLNFSPESYFKSWNISKQAKCNKSQEENAGTEKVKCSGEEVLNSQRKNCTHGTDFQPISNFTLCIARAH